MKNHGGVPRLSQSPYNIAILGKGVCKSQARVLTDLLNQSNVTKYSGIVHIDVVAGPSEFHEIVILNGNCELGNPQIKSLDPTSYNGTLESIERGYIYSVVDFGVLPEKLSRISFNEEDIEKARKTVLDYLSNRYHISNLLDEIGVIEEMSTEQKIDNILTYIKNNLVSVSENLITGSIQIANKEIECGKLFELMCYTSGIDYQIECEKEKRNTDYHILVNGEDKKYNFVSMYQTILKEKQNEKVNNVDVKNKEIGIKE